MSERMSITRALVLKKRIQERLNLKWVHNFNPAVVLVGQNSVPVGFNSIQQYRDRTKEEWQSFQDLINRREKIVAAIAFANATTNVIINNETMTIAQALEKKRFYEQTSKPLLDMLRQRQMQININFEQTRIKETEKANKEISDFANKDKGVSKAEAEAMQSIIFKRHEVILEDPINLSKIINDLSDKVEKFLNEVDVALTEINSNTYIEIE